MLTDRRRWPWGRKTTAAPCSAASRVRAESSGALTSARVEERVCLDNPSRHSQGYLGLGLKSFAVLRSIGIVETLAIELKSVVQHAYKCTRQKRSDVGKSDSLALKSAYANYNCRLL